MPTLILYLGNEAVIAELALQHLILQIEIPVLALHLLLLEFGKFLKLLILLQEGFGEELVVGQHSHRDGDECHHDADGNQESVALLLLLYFFLYISLFFHVFF